MGVEVLVADLLTTGVGEAVAGDVIGSAIAGDVIGGAAADAVAGDALAGGVLDSAATAANLIDTSANVLDTVSSVADIPSNTPFESNLPTDTGGLPSVTDGPMGPPTPDNLPTDMVPTEGAPTDSNAPQTDPNAPDSSKAPSSPTQQSKLPKIPQQVTSMVKKMLAPTPTQPTRTLGTSNQSALGASCNYSSGFRMPNFLCNQADFLTNRGSGYKGGLEKLNQITGSGAQGQSAAPICIYNMQDQMNMMGQSAVGSGLGYANGGVAHLKAGAQPEDRSVSEIFKDAFCTNKITPNYVCDKPNLLTYQNLYQGHGLSPLKHIYSTMGGGFAAGGLQSCGTICNQTCNQKKKKDQTTGGLPAVMSDAAFAAQQAQGEANSQALGNIGETIGNGIKSFLNTPPLPVQIMQTILGPNGLALGIGSTPGSPGTGVGFGGDAASGMSGLGFTANAPTGVTAADSGSGESGMNAGEGGRGAPSGGEGGEGAGASAGSAGVGGGEGGAGVGAGVGGGGDGGGGGGGGAAHGGLAKYHAAAPKGHNPEFITGMTGYYACGRGTGQSDDIPAMLHDGDYVMDAETVSALGDGSSKAGRHVLDGFRTQIPHKAEGGSNPVPAKIADGEYVFPASFVTSLGGGDNKRGAEILDGLRTKLRAHKRGAPLDKIPPKAKDPIDYIKKAKV
jgi:hypothetical protein